MSFGKSEMKIEARKSIVRSQLFAVKGASIALMVLIGTGPGLALGLGGLGGSGVSIGGGGIGVSIGGSNGVNAGVGTGGGGVSAGVGIGGSSGVTAGVGVGGTSGVTAGVGVGGTSGVGVGVGIGGTTGVSVGVGIGGATPGTTPPGGTPPGGGTPGVDVVDEDGNPVVTASTAGVMVRRTVKLPCTGGGNTAAFDGFAVRDRSGEVIGFVNDTTIGNDLSIQAVKMQSTGKVCFSLVGGSFKLSGEEVWVNADAAAFR